MRRQRLAWICVLALTLWSLGGLAGCDDKKTEGEPEKSGEPANKGEAPAKKGEDPANKGEAPAKKGEAPANKGEAPEGQTHKVEDLPVLSLDKVIERVKASKAKVTVVAMWATWCAPCIEEMPHFAKLYAKHKKDGLEVLGLSVDDKAAMGKKIQAIFDRVKPAYPQAIIEAGTEEAFMKGVGVEDWDGGLPVTMAFDAEGRKLFWTRDQMDEEKLAARVEPLLAK